MAEIILLERKHRIGAEALKFCNCLGRSGNGQWMPMQAYGLGNATLFAEGFNAGRIIAYSVPLTRLERLKRWWCGEAVWSYVCFKDPAGIPIVPPDEWRQADKFEIAAVMRAEGAVALWTQVIERRSAHG